MASFCKREAWRGIVWCASSLPKKTLNAAMELMHVASTSWAVHFTPWSKTNHFCSQNDGLTQSRTRRVHSLAWLWYLSCIYDTGMSCHSRTFFQDIHPRPKIDTRIVCTYLCTLPKAMTTSTCRHIVHSLVMAHLPELDEWMQSRDKSQCLPTSFHMSRASSDLVSAWLETFKSCFTTILGKYEGLITYECHIKSRLL